MDLLYTSLMAEQPLGYLLHHRGHSHTLPGLAALGMLIGSCLLRPRIRRAVDGTEQRWILLIAAALLSHLLMDTANGYGTHILYPVSSRWVFGDAVFVLEPWLWALLGAMLAVNARHRRRVLVVLVTLVPIGAVVYAGLLQAGVLAVMLSAAGLAVMMQFGCVPYVTDGHIVDLRFETPIGQNFTRMVVDAPSRGCPAHLTRWELPRQDVLLANP